MVDGPEGDDHDDHRPATERASPGDERVVPDPRPGEASSEEGGGERPHQSDAEPRQTPRGEWEQRGPPGDDDAHEWRPPHEADEMRSNPDEVDGEELHPALDVLADLSIYLVVGSLLLAVVGLAAIAVGIHPYGRVLIAGASIGAMGSMTLAALVGTASGMFSPFD